MADTARLTGGRRSVNMMNAAVRLMNVGMMRIIVGSEFCALFVTAGGVLIAAGNPILSECFARLDLEFHPAKRLILNTFN